MFLVHVFISNFAWWASHFFAPAVNLNIYVVLNRQKFIFCIFTALHLLPLLVKLIKPEPNGQGAYIACNFNFVMKTQCSFQNCTCSYISTTSVEASCCKTESFIVCGGGDGLAGRGWAREEGGGGRGKGKWERDKSRW